MTQRVKINDRYKGIFYIILAVFGFAFMNLFVKLAGDLPAIEKSFFRNLVAIFFAFLAMKKGKITFSIPKGSEKYIFFFANFYAIGKLYIADASMLNKLSPFFAIIFSYFLLKEKIKPYQLICVIVAFIGLIGGMGAGLAYTNVRIASKHGVPGPLIVFCFSVFSCVCAIPFIIWNPQPLAWWQLGSLLMAGLSATLGQFSITAAYTYAPASELSVYDYTQIVFAALLGMIFLGEVPDMISILGYFIICGAGVAMFLIRRKKETKLE